MKKIIMMAVLIFSANFLWGAKQVLNTVSDNFATPISFDVVDGNVSSVLDALAGAAGVNIVQSEETKKKKISLSLKDVPGKDAFDLVIRATGLSYQLIGNSIIVATPKQIDREIGLTTSVFDLQYAEASKVKAMLADITKKVQIDDIGNRVIYQASPKLAKEIEKVLTRIDRPLQQVMFKAKITEISNDEHSKYGLDWSKIKNYSTTIREGSYSDWGTWGFTEATESTPGKWEFTYDESVYPVRDMGGDLGNDLSMAGATSMNGRATQTNSLLNTVWHRQIQQQYLLSLDFQLNNGNGTVLAEPEISTINNKEAYIHIGDRVPYTVTTVSQGTTQQSIQKEEVGVKLKIKPIINEENDITVTIDAEVSSIYGWKGPNQEIPWVKVRKAITTVRVKDAQTIHIGGMTLTDESYSIDKLPLLGDIPWLGYLFQHRVKTLKKTNLVIDITPYIMIDGQVVTEETEEEQMYDDE